MQQGHAHEWAKTIDKSKIRPHGIERHLRRQVLNAGQVSMTRPDYQPISVLPACWQPLAFRHSPKHFESQVQCPVQGQEVLEEGAREGLWNVHEVLWGSHVARLRVSQM